MPITRQFTALSKGVAFLLLSQWINNGAILAWDEIRSKLFDDVDSNRHWGVDMVFKEDQRHIGSKNSAKNMATSDR